MDNTYKIKRLGSKKAKYMTCGLERMDVSAADLLVRMEGVTVTMEEEEKLLDVYQRPAFLNAGKMTCTTVIESNKEPRRRYITIALSPAKTGDGESLLSLRIEKRQFAQLRRILDFAETPF